MTAERTPAGAPFLRPLGATGIQVSRLCFGTLTLSPLQKNLSPEAGAELLTCAAQLGVNFLDTAELYDNYPAIALALKRKPDWVIATKSYAYSAQMARDSVEKALRALNRDYVDIFLLHEQESGDTLRGHFEAVEELHRLKALGKVRAVGLSTHHIAAVRASCARPEIEVIHPILNARGWGIQDGAREQMERAVAQAHEIGKGVYLMKALCGGHMISDYAAAMDYALGVAAADAVAVGMGQLSEVAVNVARFRGEAADPAQLAAVGRTDRRLMIHDYCQGCGACVAACRAGALSLVDGRAAVDDSRCIRCGYCSARCPLLCIKVV
ncbi:MAG: aldo/keto reductase [Christensenellales bacterium]|jgi:aryl-alcohol dehydrogenase-like predicted oxidoreductase